MNDNQAAHGSVTGLRRLMLRGSAFELVGYGLSMVLRLACNVLLSRLLFPKAFGLSAEINLILFGLTMLSDVGILQCVIQSPRGDDESFLNTAFTMQAVRGCIMAAIGVALSYPVAHLWFREPELGPLLLVSSSQELILGLRSTSILTLRRRLHLGWINGLGLFQQVVNFVVVIAWARVQPSPWAIVGAGLVSIAASTIATHFVPIGYRNRFHWDRDAYRELTGFGRWIFGSSAIFFFGSQGDRALFGRLLGAQSLGIYQIASELSAMPSMIIDRLTSAVLYPALSKVARGQDNAGLRRLYYRSRLALDTLGQLGLGVLCGIGGWIVRLIWDSRYWEAGWMLGVLCLRASVACLVGPAETVLSSMGMPRFVFMRSLLRASTVWISLPLGYHLAGVPGLVWATALSEVPALLVLWPKSKSLGILRLERELFAAVLFAAGFGVARAVEPWLPAVHLFRHHH
jgi:O-antigen/teichoic acid export membrane protein